MKKAFFVFLFIFLFAFTVSADAKDDILGEFEFSGIYDAIGDEAKAELGTVEDFKVPTSGSLLTYLSSALFSLIKPMLADVAAVFCYIVIAALIKHTALISGTDGVMKASELALLLALASLCFVNVKADFESVSEFLMQIKAYFVSAIPIMSGMYALGGNVGVAAASGASSSVILSLVEVIAESVIMPSARLCFAMMLAGAMSPDINLSPVASFIKNFVSKSLSLVMGLIASGMLLSCKLAAASDSVAVRVMKFSASSFIPIVGGAVSEATATVLSALSLVKSSFGIFGIAAILYILLPIFLKIVLHRLVYLAASSFASGLGCNSEGAFLKDISEIYGIVISAIVSVSICFILSLAVFINTTAVR